MDIGRGMNSFNRREYQTVILGALLHDVGKGGIEWNLD